MSAFWEAGKVLFDKKKKKNVALTLTTKEVCCRLNLSSSDCAKCLSQKVGTVSFLISRWTHETLRYSISFETTEKNNTAHDAAVSPSPLAEKKTKRRRSSRLLAAGRPFKWICLMPPLQWEQEPREGGERKVDRMSRHGSMALLIFFF